MASPVRYHHNILKLEPIVAVAGRVVPGSIEHTLANPSRGRPEVRPCKKQLYELADMLRADGLISFLLDNGARYIIKSASMEGVI